MSAIGYRYVETGNHGSPYEVTGLPAPHSALRATVTATHTTGAERTTQPSSGLAYPVARVAADTAIEAARTAGWSEAYIATLML